MSAARRPRSGPLARRLAGRELRLGRSRYLLAGLVIVLAIAGGTVADILVRSTQLGDERYATWTLGDTASARVLSLGAGAAQQSPRADVATGGGSAETIDEAQDRLGTLLDGTAELLPVGTSPMAVRLDDALTDGLRGMQAPFDDPVLAGVIDTFEGRAPAAVGEMSISRDLASRVGAALGDELQVTTDPAEGFDIATVVGIHQNNPLRWGTDVAIFAPPMGHSAAELSAPTVTWFVHGPEIDWETVRQANDAGFVMATRAVILDPPPASEVPLFQNGGDYESSILLGVLIAVAVAVIVGGTLVILLVSPVFAISARASRRDYALLRAQGAPAGLIRAVMLRTASVVGAVAAVGGALLGIATSICTVLLTQRFGSTAFPNLVIPWWDLVGLAAIGVAVSTFSAYLPARRAAAEDPVAGLYGIDARERTASRSSRIVMLITLASGLGLAVLAIATGTRVWWLPAGVAFTVALLLGARYTLPALARLASRLSIAPRVAMRDAARRADRTLPTVTGVAAAIALSVCVAIVTATQFATAQANWAPRAEPGTVFVYDGPYLETGGSDDPFTGSQSEAGAGGKTTITDDADRTRIEETIREFIPDSELVDARMLTLEPPYFPRIAIDPAVPCPAWADKTELHNDMLGLPTTPDERASAGSLNCWIDKAGLDLNYQPRWTTTGGGDIVVDDGTLVRALNLPGAEAAAQALAEGHIVVTRPIDRWPDGTAHLAILKDDEAAMAEWRDLVENSPNPVYENPPDPITVAEVVTPTVVVDWPSAQWYAFIPPTLLASPELEDAGAAAERVGLVATGPGHQLAAPAIDELRARLLNLGIYQVAQAREYANAGLATSLALLALISILIALAATWATTRLATTDMRPDLQVLHDIGAAPTTRQRITAFATATVGALGSIIGTLAGIALGTAVAYTLAAQDDLQRGTWMLTAPPALLITIVLGIPLIAALGALLTTRVRPSNTARREKWRAA